MNIQRFNPVIAYHAKHEHRGWSEVCRERADWPGWNNTDVSMINEMLEQGEMCVTLGWNMWEVVRETVST